MSQNLERSLRIFEVVALLSLPENTLVADPQGDLGQVEVLEERDDVFAGDPPGEVLELRNGDLALLPEEGDEFLLQRTDRAGVEVQVLHPQALAPLGEPLQRLLELPPVPGAQGIGELRLRECGQTRFADLRRDRMGERRG